MGLVLVIMLSLILIMFVLAITSIVLGEYEKAKVKFSDRLLGVLIFVFVSAIILGILAFLFWYQI